MLQISYDGPRSTSRWSLSCTSLSAGDTLSLNHNGGGHAIHHHNYPHHGRNGDSFRLCNDTAAMPSTMSDANVVLVLNAIDKSEIDTGQVAKQKGSSSDIRGFAAHMVDDHMAMTEKHCQLVKQLNVQPEKPQLASALQGTHEEAMEELRTKSGQGLRPCLYRVPDQDA